MTHKIGDPNCPCKYCAKRSKLPAVKIAEAAPGVRTCGRCRRPVGRRFNDCQHERVAA